MSIPIDAVWLVLAALVVGVFLPLCAQAFLALRSARQSVERLAPKIERSLDDLATVTTRLRSPPRSAGAEMAAAGAAAIFAAVKAYREHAAAASSAGPNGTHEAARAGVSEGGAP